MRRHVRRFLLFQAFLLWQGGFLFYAAVVVPVGTDVLGSAEEQGLVTRRVTVWLNGFGAAWAAAMLWDLLAAADPNRCRRRFRWAAWGVSVGLLAALAVLHRDLGVRLDGDRGRGWRAAFRFAHGLYLSLSTAQWAAALALAWATLRAWAAEDRAAATSSVPGGTRSSSA